MNRKRAERWLSLYLDGELDARRSSRLQQWLARDTELQHLLDDWRRTGRLLQDRPVPTVDPDQAWHDVRRIVRSDVPEARGRFMSGASWAAPRVWLGAAAAVLVMCGALWILAGHSGRTARLAAADPAQAPAEVEWAETSLPGASTMVYRDEETGLTIIWLVEADEPEQEGADS